MEPTPSSSNMETGSSSRNENSSGTECIRLDVLYSDDLYKNTNLVEKIFMYVCAAATLFTLITFMDTAVYTLRRYNTSTDIKCKSLQIIGIYPAVSVATLFALFIPQAVSVATFFALFIPQAVPVATVFTLFIPQAVSVATVFALFIPQAVSVATLFALFIPQAVSAVCVATLFALFIPQAVCVATLFALFIPQAVSVAPLFALFLPQAVSVATLFALFIPQADLLCELMITVYISRSMFHFVSLMTLYFGGKERLLQRLRDDKIDFRSPPLCCCCFCLPKIATTERNIQILKVLVLQAAIVQPILNLAILVLWLDGKYVAGKFGASNAYSYLVVPNVMSTLLSLFAFIALYRLCRKYLLSVSITAKFLALQLVIVFTRLQTAVLSVLATQGIPPCRGVLSTQVLSQTYQQIIIILEMFLLSQLARRVYRTSHDQVATLVSMEMEMDRNDLEPEANVENGCQMSHTP
ncbi:organic solute transporter subunit alpha-like [Plakobranchus ocellatus]|uniref:Organic solute transporter subunit alpha-like n=1 Tax=Plakobranchus ocellatus TaxID=259542 RepID=A0AAV3Y9J7_9GAST|nr:organic solute transporter subunit alpha-like [Plakobranchus ocellatus]